MKTVLRKGVLGTRIFYVSGDFSEPQLGNDLPGRGGCLYTTSMSSFASSKFCLMSWLLISSDDRSTETLWISLVSFFISRPASRKLEEDLSFSRSTSQVSIRIPLFFILVRRDILRPTIFGSMTFKSAFFVSWKDEYLSIALFVGAMTILSFRNGYRWAFWHSHFIWQLFAHCACVIHLLTLIWFGHGFDDSRRLEEIRARLANFFMHHFPYWCHSVHWCHYLNICRWHEVEGIVMFIQAPAPEYDDSMSSTLLSDAILLTVGTTSDYLN